MSESSGARSSARWMERYMAKCDMVDACGQDWYYTPLPVKERDVLLAQMLLDITMGRFTVAGSLERWNTGWQENLDAFEGSYDVESLVPRYVRPFQPMRIDQELVMPSSPYFERNWWRLILDMLRQEYLFDGAGPLLEFGCGSGWNVAQLARANNAPEIWGLDWSFPAVQIVERLREVYGYRVFGKLFNFFDPNSLEIPAGATILTVGALEQTGGNFRPFIDQLVDSKVRLVVHVEPIIEWYDCTNLVDLTAVLFLRKRGYWWGFPSYMEKLEREGKVVIEEKRRLYVGSKYMEGYMLYVWRPM